MHVYIEWSGRLSERVASEQRQLWGGVVQWCYPWEKSTLGRGASQYRGSAASVAGAEGAGQEKGLRSEKKWEVSGRLDRLPSTLQEGEPGSDII